ncbi:cysteine protease ATG4A isoform X1, partial [Tachysurus ichikawai]
LAKYENQINVFSEFLEDLPDTEGPVWLLGESYNVKTEKSELLSDVRSRLWFTYRKKFSPIGGTGPSSDTGWGCMLRCGQMILAQALICSHLGRTWRWLRDRSQPAEYQRILHCFLDRKDSCYSIHQMGE